MKRLTAVIIIAAVVAVLTGCGLSASPAADGAGADNDEKLEKFSGYVFEAFDTVISVTAYCGSQEEFDRLMATARNEFLRYHRLYDIYFTYPGMNNLRSVNDGAGITPVEVGPEITDLLLFSKHIYERTGGKINVAMGSVLSIWHTAREYNNVVPEADAILPDPDELRQAAKHCCMDDVVIDEAAGTVFLADPEMSLDVGAVAKGFATERVVQTLSEAGFERFVINAGGNVRCFGTKPGGKSWSVAVTNPGLPGYGESIGTVSVPGGSIVTSGSYQRFFACEGRRYHHIIDPDTLMPEDRYLSVTVIAEDSGFADALSTSLFNMEIGDGLKFVENLDGVEAMWVLSDGSRSYSSNFVLNN